MRKGMIMTNNNIILTWKESLSLFKGNSLKLFILASLNNALRSFTIFFKQFWWVSALLLTSVSSMIAFVKFSATIVPQATVNWLILLPMLSLFILTMFSLLLFILVMFLVVRASSEKKDNIYVKNNLGKIWGLFFMMMILGLFTNLVAYYFGRPLVSGINATPNMIINVPFTMSLFIILGFIFTFAMFFFLDSKARVLSILQSFWKAIKLFVYYLPVMFLLIVISLSINFFNSMLLSFNSIFAGNIVLYSCFWLIYIIIVMFTSFVSLSFIANYYTMVRHKNYKLFYGDK